MAPLISFPLSRLAAIETLDGSNWPSWSLHMLALFHMNGVRTHITDDKPSPNKAIPNLVTDWEVKEEIVLGVLKMYYQKDV